MHDLPWDANMDDRLPHPDAAVAAASRQSPAGRSTATRSRTPTSPTRTATRRNTPLPSNARDDLVRR